MTEVRTRDEAIAIVDQALQAWSMALTGILEQALGVMRAATNQAEGAVRERGNQVAALRDLLAATTEAERRRSLQAELGRAEEVYETARRARVRVNDVASGVAQLSRDHTTGAVMRVSGARARLAAMSRALDGYRTGGTMSGGGGGGHAIAVGGGGSALAGMGLTELDVNAADLDEYPVLDDRLVGAFGKGGLSRADFRWAVQTWNDTVGPGVAGGKTRDVFAERDALSNARPLRRTADVYDLFLGSDRIRADRRPDGSLNIVNGRHRLLIARELGIRSLPGELS